MIARLPMWQRLILGLAFLLPLACNLTTVEPTASPFPTATAIANVSTMTPSATSTRTASPTPTKTTAPQQPTAKPVYNLLQPVPAPICAVVPNVDASNIRSGAGMNFPVIGVLPAGNWVMVSRLLSSGWYQIVALGTVVNGGWISSTVVNLQQPCICTPDSCAQSGIVPPPPTPQPSGVPKIGVVGLKPSGAGPCVITNGGSDIPVFSVPEGDPPVIAMVVPYGGLVAFDYRALRYAVNFYVGSQAMVGWVNANRVTTEGDCAPLTTPVICSVQASLLSAINVYAEPKRDAKVIDSMNQFDTRPFIQKNADGWFSVNLGFVGSGWIAPDEGKLVGPC